MTEVPMLSRGKREELEETPTSSLVSLLYERHAATIIAYIRPRVPTREDAEDILLDVFLAVHEHTFLLERDALEQLAWLRRIAHNKCVDFYRHARRHPQVSLEEQLALGNMQDPRDEDYALLPEQIVLRNEAHARLYAHLASLPHEHREVLRLRFGAGMRCVDIAKMLQLREGTIRARLSRSLNALRALYGKHEGRSDLDG